MFHIKRPVLAAVALDEDSREILAQAEDLARAHKVKLQICHVLPEIFAVRPLYPQFQLGDALQVSQLEASVCSALYQCMLDASIRDPSQVEILIEQGTAHAGILRVMGRIRAGAMVVGGKLSPNDPLFLGKTAEAIVRYADCPVWVARPRRTGVVLAATDFSDPSLPVVDVAAAEAQRRKLDLAIIHVLDPVPVGLRAYGEFAGLPLMAFRNQMKEALQQRLDDCVVRFNARAVACCGWAGGVCHP